MGIKTITFKYFITMNVIHLVSSGCVLHTFGDSSESSIGCQELSSLEKMKPLRAQGIRKISVTNSEIPTLAANSFEDFRELREISLPGNSIEEIEYDVFSSEDFDTILPFLITVDLSENNIEMLQSEVFNYSSMLELNLASNGLKEIELGAFRNVAKLKKLDLSYNQISIPDEENTVPLGVFQDVATLAELNLSYNSLKTIKMGTFSLLPYLFVLDLSHNELIHLPAGIFTGSAIQELYLNDNNLVFFEYPNGKHIHTVINLVNNDFECNFLAKTLNEIPKGLFTKGSTLTEPNIYGIACREEDVNGEDDDEEEDGILGQIYVLKYLGIATLSLGVILSCYVFFCQRIDDENDDDEPVLKEVTPLHRK